MISCLRYFAACIRYAFLLVYNQSINTIVLRFNIRFINYSLAHKPTCSSGEYVPPTLLPITRLTRQLLVDIVTGDDNRVVLPGVVGTGKVLCSSSSLESLYLGNGNPQLRELIADFIAVVAPAPPSYRVTAPSALISNMTVSGKVHVLHLTNWTGNKFERFT